VGCDEKVGRMVEMDSLFPEALSDTVLMDHVLLSFFDSASAEHTGIQCKKLIESLEQV
jgi:hypothetical protein